MEVAEHIENSSSESFVKGICSKSDTVVFSAAIPKQYGENHINEQWQSFWADLFAKHGYKPFDIVRPLVWKDQRIQYYYRQNCLVYCKEGSEHFETLKNASFERSSLLIDIVHPEVFTKRMSLRGGLSSIKKAIFGGN